MRIGEVKIHNTENGSIWVKRINEYLYLVNDVYCVISHPFDMENPEILQGFLDEKDDVLSSYPGADKGWAIIYQTLPNDPRHCSICNIRLLEIRDLDSIDYMRVLDEYKEYRRSAGF